MARRRRGWRDRAGGRRRERKLLYHKVISEATARRRGTRQTTIGAFVCYRRSHGSRWYRTAKFMVPSPKVKKVARGERGGEREVWAPLRGFHGGPLMMMATEKCRPLDGSQGCGGRDVEEKVCRSRGRLPQEPMLPSLPTPAPSTPMSSRLRYRVSTSLPWTLAANSMVSVNRVGVNIPQIELLAIWVGGMHCVIMTKLWGAQIFGVVGLTTESPPKIPIYSSVCSYGGVIVAIS